jgi:hypothetical protein
MERYYFSILMTAAAGTTAQEAVEEMLGTDLPRTMLLVWSSRMGHC